MSGSTLLHECAIEFIECLLHQLLAMREIYPSYLFERTTKYGISLWQCRHAEVSSYITRVLSNARPALEQNLADQIIFATYDACDQVVDHICIDCNLVSPSFSSTTSLSTASTEAGRESCRTGPSGAGATFSTPQDFVKLEGDLRSVVLGVQCQLGRANKSLSKFQESSRWEVMLVLRPTPCIDENGEVLSSEVLGAGDVAVVDSLLRSGQWLEDTSQLSAELARSRKSDIRDFSEERSSSSPMINAFKFR